VPGEGGIEYLRKVRCRWPMVANQATDAALGSRYLLLSDG